MKATKKYNKSRVMTNAWDNFKSNEGRLTFSQCLVGAWKYEKELVGGKYDATTKSVKELHDLLVEGLYSSREYTAWESMAEEILNLVAKKSNGFQKDIAKKALIYNRISEKQAWCVAYEFKNVA